MIARIVEHGFVTPGPERAQRPDEPYRVRFVDGLDAPVQYFMVALDEREVVVATRSADLAGVFGDRLVVVLRDDRAGHARIAECDRPELAAAAVGAVKTISGWDETSPIVVEVGDRALAVFLDFTELQWHARVEPAQR